MRLSELVRSLGDLGGMGEPQCLDFADVEIARVVCDSRQVRKGDLFVAIPGTKADGHEYALKAIEAGASAVAGTREVDAAGHVPQILVPDARKALAVLSHAVLGHPSAGMTLVGITGTKGKTTTSYIARSILRAAGYKPGLIGTVVYDTLRRTVPAPLTTPDAAGLAECFAELRSAGGDSAVMEVSSIALDQGRSDGLEFSSAIFTNLSGDHLDYHGTMEDYCDAKAKLFSGLGRERVAALNADNEWSIRVARKTRCRIMWYSVGALADVWADDARIDATGSRYRINWAGRSATVSTGLVGEHNIANGLGAAAAALGMGLDFGAVVEGLCKAPAVPGRLEPVKCGQDFAVLVDYAHTDDSLAKVLAALRPLTPGRLLALFGCGGDRDRTKRPRMAAAAEAGADLVFVTSDNPRTESPVAIVNEILAGFSKDGMRRVRVNTDRRGAIGDILAEARPGDVVLLAGKGHEDYQIIGTTKIPFDDRLVAAEWLGLRRGAAGG
jgi:UDP-N-acetylmuramoyl-L-alanyl-D-glutamate--2,6-diaminopimelate ligase